VAQLTDQIHTKICFTKCNDLTEMIREDNDSDLNQMNVALIMLF